MGTVFVVPHCNVRTGFVRGAVKLPILNDVFDTSEADRAARHLGSRCGDQMPWWVRAIGRHAHPVCFTPERYMCWPPEVPAPGFWPPMGPGIEPAPGFC